jgi:hypothetical protein
MAYRLTRDLLGSAGWFWLQRQFHHELGKQGNTGICRGAPKSLDGTESIREFVRVRTLDSLEGALAVLADERPVVDLAPEAFAELVTQAQGTALVFQLQSVEDDLSPDDFGSVLQTDLSFVGRWRSGGGRGAARARGVRAQLRVRGWLLLAGEHV